METVIPQDKQVAVINNSLEVFKGAPGILLKHQDRSKKAMAVANSILKQWELAYTIQDPDRRREALAAVDQRSNDFLANCGKACEEMQDSRKAITQLMDMLKKMYTEEENKLDVKKGMLPASIQSKRNVYAKELLEEQERNRKLAEERVAKGKEEIEIRSYIKNKIADCLLNYLANRKITINNRFNDITLQNFEEKSANLLNMACGFPAEKLSEIVKYSNPFYARHSDQEYLVIQGDVEHGYDFNSFYTEYSRQITDLKQSLVDRLPSKKEELLEQKRLADEAEQLRQAELKRQQEAEAERQKQLAASKNEEERKRRECEAEDARRAEAERLILMEREAEEKKQQAEEEQKRRQKEEADRLAREAEERRKAVSDEIELNKAAGTAQLLFEQANESALTSPAPESRTAFDITVTHPAGWVELFQFWYQKEGCKMKADDMGKKSLNQMKAFAEGIAKKTGEKIESKFLRYDTSIKSVNRKATV